MNVPVNRRVLLHRHVGFATHVAINSRVVEVLSRISGLELIEGPAHPGHMCSALAAVPGALAAAAEGTWSAAAANSCDTVCTIFHSCHRELAALDGKDNIRIRNWVHLVAELMGIEASDSIGTGARARLQVSPPSSGPRKRDIASSSNRNCAGHPLFGNLA